MQYHFEPGGRDQVVAAPLLLACCLVFFFLENSQCVLRRLIVLSPISISVKVDF